MKKSPRIWYAYCIMYSMNVPSYDFIWIKVETPSVQKRRGCTQQHFRLIAFDRRFRNDLSEQVARSGSRHSAGNVAACCYLTVHILFLLFVFFSSSSPPSLHLRIICHNTQRAYLFSLVLACYWQSTFVKLLLLLVIDNNHLLLFKKISNNNFGIVTVIVIIKNLI